MKDTKTEANDLAYPTEVNFPSNGGLTKREYFAIMAMQGLLANYQSDGRYGNSPAYPQVAETAVRQADALIQQLNTPNTEK